MSSTSGIRSVELFVVGYSNGIELRRPAELNTPFGIAAKIRTRHRHDMYLINGDELA